MFKISTLLKVSDFNALRKEYSNEDETYFRYMLSNSSMSDDAETSKAA